MSSLFSKVRVTQLEIDGSNNFEKSSLTNGIHSLLLSFINIQFEYAHIIQEFSNVFLLCVCFQSDSIYISIMSIFTLCSSMRAAVYRTNSTNIKIMNINVVQASLFVTVAVNVTSTIKKGCNSFKLTIHLVEIVYPFHWQFNDPITILYMKTINDRYCK